MPLSKAAHAPPSQQKHTHTDTYAAVPARPVLAHDRAHQKMPISPFSIQRWHPRSFPHQNSTVGRWLAFRVRFSICRYVSYVISPAGKREASLKGGSTNPPPPSHSPTSTTACDVIQMSPKVRAPESPSLHDAETTVVTKVSYPGRRNWPHCSLLFISSLVYLY